LSWLRRIAGEDHGGQPQPAPPAEEDTPESLDGHLRELVVFVNRNAGKLPVEAVVVAREITDTIGEVIEAAFRDGHPDVYAIVSINGIVGDYLPTTLRTYLNLDPRLTVQVGPSGRTPRAALREQLDALASAATDLLRAAQAHDVDALSTQGNFLQTKFSRSDLDL
jgi:hypothetical protein